MATVNERDRNLGRVLEALMARGETTRSELMAATNLSKATVSRQVAELERIGLLASGEQVATEKRGRQSIELFVPSTAGLVAGVSIGLRGTNVSLSDLAGRELHHHVEQTPHLETLHDFTGWAAGLIAEARGEAGGGELLQVAVAIPGQVRERSRILRAPEPLAPLEGSEFSRGLGRAAGAPVSIDTDAVMALEGSIAAGLTDETTPAALFVMSTALTVIARTEHGLISGRSAAFGDFGLLPVGLPGADSARGDERIGSLLSVRGLSAYASDRGSQITRTSELWTSDAPGAVAARDAFAAALAAAIQVVTVTTGPEICILTGRLSPLAARVLPEVNGRLEEALLGDAPRIVSSGLGDDGHTITRGAARVALARAQVALLQRVVAGQAGARD